MAQLRGVFAIPVTPFTDDGNFDEGSYRSVLQFCVTKGAHGITGPVIASEFYSLSDDERFRVAEIIMEEINGRLPVILSVSACSRELAVRFAKHAKSVGADAIIALPPYVKRESLDRVYRFYCALIEETQLPLVVQNSSDQIGTPLPPEFIQRLTREFDDVYLKSEVFPAHSHQITSYKELCGDRLKGIFGGMGGKWLLDELQRGIIGTMVACEVIDVHTQIFEAYMEGDEKRARQIYNQLLPLINMETLLADSLTKEVLKRRGVIASSYVRIPAGTTFDEYDHSELAKVLNTIEPLFRPDE